MQAFAIGKDTLLQGEYRLLEMIGGTESRVYLAKRTSPRPGSEQHDALVVARLWQPSEELLHENRAQALFERALGQMRAATLLRHPSLAMVETCGGLDDGTLFMVSEHVEGTPLDAFVDKAGIPPLPSVIDLAYRVCSGLNAAHRNGLGHAALHPRSFIVRPHNEGGALTRLHAKLIDFGAPTCMFSSPPSLHAARFMAPEQLELALKPAIERAEPTVRMNVYGCGALLYYLCTGGPPLPGQSLQELLVAQAAHKVPPPSRINPQVIPALDAIILKALAPEPRARFANAAELANALISIRFERSASGVRHRAVSEDRATRDRRITLEADVSSDDATHVIDSGLEERPTSQTKKPPPLPPGSQRRSEPSASPFDRPTALMRATLPPETPLPPLTPLPPSVPPSLPTLPPTLPPPSMPEDEITAETPLPTRAELEREAAPERPAVLARPARKSIAPVQDLLSHFYPGAFIALAALISISIIYAVISQPSEEDAAITVTPLPAPTPAPRVRTTPAPTTPSSLAGAAATEPAQPAPAPVSKSSDASTRESRARRPARVVEGARERVPPSLDAASASEHLVVRAQPEPPPEPEPPEPPAIARPEPEPAPAAPSAAKSPPPSTEQPATTARAPIAPLPEAPRVKPIAPLSDKATPRFYEVQVKGSLATSQIRRGIERIQSATQGCYRTALAAKPSALGELSLEVVIDERGRARTARVSGAAPGSLQRCLESAALRITVTPPDTGTVTATWKVSL